MNWAQRLGVSGRLLGPLTGLAAQFTIWQMNFAAIARALGKPYLVFAHWFTPNKEKLTLGDHLVGGFVFLVLAIWLFAGAAVVVYGTWQDYQFSRLSYAGHLSEAIGACGTTTRCSDTSKAIKNLRAIPSTAAEYSQASRLLAQISSQLAEDQEKHDQIAREQMLRNFNGSAQDPFQCGLSTNGEDIVSFDNGTTWWKDDGRCAERLQRKRDEDAQISSYWSTTLRVDTDMNSSWLPEEQRVCQTYPDAKGRVSSVRCSTSSERATHNIPVVFWGGVNRNTVSDWKCTREKGLSEDRFVCRAID